MPCTGELWGERAAHSLHGSLAFSPPAIGAGSRDMLAHPGICNWHIVRALMLGMEHLFNAGSGQAFHATA